MTGDVRQTAQERFCDPIVAEHEQDTTSDGTGPQNGPEGPMESLAGLRAYVRRHARMDEMIKAAPQVYAREIEREVGGMQRALTIDAKPMTDENMAESGWIRLPMDADGEVIHIGDLVDEKLPFGGYAAPAPIDTMELSRGASGYRWMVKLDAENRALVNPKLLRHHHEPTVEDVLDEFVARWMDTHHDDLPALKAEYSAKLALRGDE